jgi:hypothetical protein
MRIAVRLSLVLTVSLEKDKNLKEGKEMNVRSCLHAIFLFGQALNGILLFGQNLKWHLLLE